MDERTSVGLDVHARSVVACAIDGETGELHRAQLSPDFGEIDRWLARLEGPVAVVYEAGPTGYGLATEGCLKLKITLKEQTTKDLYAAPGTSPGSGGPCGAALVADDR